jgi:hypothetical protein
MPLHIINQRLLVDSGIKTASLDEDSRHALLLTTQMMLRNNFNDQILSRTVALINTKNEASVLGSPLARIIASHLFRYYIGFHKGAKLININNTSPFISVKKHNGSVDIIYTHNPSVADLNAVKWTIHNHLNHTVDLRFVYLAAVVNKQDIQITMKVSVILTFTSPSIPTISPTSSARRDSDRPYPITSSTPVRAIGTPNPSSPNMPFRLTYFLGGGADSPSESFMSNASTIDANSKMLDTINNDP